MDIFITKVKPIFFCILPLLLLFIIDWADNFIGWKKTNLILRKDVTTATIIKNPFYALSKDDRFLDDYGNTDDEKLTQYIEENLVDKEYIEYSYEVDGIKYSNKLRFTYYVDYSSDPELGSNYSEWTYQLSEFMPLINTSKVGQTIKIYYYKDLSYPTRVVDAVQKEEGFFRMTIFNSYVIMLFIALIISAIIGYNYFYKKN